MRYPEPCMTLSAVQGGLISQAPLSDSFFTQSVKNHLAMLTEKLRIKTMQTMNATNFGLAGSAVTNHEANRPRYRSYDRMNDAQLVTCCQQGDKSAMDTLIARFKRPIYALAYRLAGNYDDANDVAAAAILRICQNIKKCKSAVTLPAWVNRIVANTFYDMCRTAKKHPSVSLEAITADTDASSLPFLDSQAKSPLALVTESEQRDILHRVLSRLPGLHAQILSQFYLEERSYEEISEMTKVPIGTVKSRLNRARQSMLRKLEAHRTAFVV